jgi:hypothetical protein
MDFIHSLQKSQQYNNSRKKTIEGFMSKGALAGVIIVSIIAGIAGILFLMSVFK